MSVLSASPVPDFEFAPYLHSSPTFIPAPAVFNSHGGYSAPMFCDASRQLLGRQPLSAASFHPVHPAAPGYLSTSATQTALVASFTSPIVSPREMLVVHRYSPTEGEAEALLTVDAEMRLNEIVDPCDPVVPNPVSQPDLKLRIVLGRTALRTSVRESFVRQDEAPNVNAQHNRVLVMRICAQVPSYADARFPERYVVPMTLQALTPGSEVYDSVTFGTFTYWQPHAVNLPTDNLNPSPRAKRVREDDEYRDFTRCSPSLRTGAGKPASELSLIRTSSIPPGKGESASYPALLEWVPTRCAPHPNDIERQWDPLEVEMGRRLVRFYRAQEGAKLLVSCESVPQEEYDEQDIVISCIRRADKGTCWFTSVDVIYLLERLVGDPFSVEEKNRIRRNLEGFKPTTVSKHRPGYEEFFQQIMDFPPPKPRNIEKDVKVFPWHILSQAIEKIMSKYSVCSTAEIVGPLSSPSPESSASMLPSDIEQSNESKFNGDLPTLVQTYESHAPATSNIRSPALIHSSETTGRVGFSPDGVLQNYSFTYPQPHDDALSASWQRRTDIPRANDGVHSPSLIQGQDNVHPSFPSHSQPFTNAFVQNPTNVTLNEFVGRRLEKAESYAHITPLSGSPALRYLSVNGAENGPITRSSSAATSLELGYPGSYSDSPLSDVPNYPANGFIETNSQSAIPFSEYSNPNVSYEEVIDSH